jgi:hypothetical protein
VNLRQLRYFVAIGVVQTGIGRDELDELRSGEVEHAIAHALPHAASSTSIFCGTIEPTLSQ